MSDRPEQFPGYVQRHSEITDDPDTDNAEPKSVSGME
jgi:hypothetical protein